MTVEDKSQHYLGDNETVSLFCEETLWGVCPGSHVFLHEPHEHQACTLVEPFVCFPTQLKWTSGCSKIGCVRAHRGDGASIRVSEGTEEVP